MLEAEKMLEAEIVGRMPQSPAPCALCLNSFSVFNLVSGQITKDKKNRSAHRACLSLYIYGTGGSAATFEEAWRNFGVNLSRIGEDFGSAFASDSEVLDELLRRKGC